MAPASSARRNQNPEWYAATIGGLGLTGILVWVEIQLKRILSSKIAVDTLAFHSLQEFLDITRESEQSGFEYTVAWIDCLSGRNARGIFYRGNHAGSGELVTKGDGGGLRVPFALPEFALNRLTVKAFNTLYYGLKARAKRAQLVDYGPFFYPLDAVRDVEPDLRPSRADAVSMRGSGGRVRSLSGDSARHLGLRRRLLPRGDQEVRRHRVPGHACRFPGRD